MEKGLIYVEIMNSPDAEPCVSIRAEIPKAELLTDSSGLRRIPKNGKYAETWKHLK